MKLWHYIEGVRKGKEAHRLEKEAMRDPFLADALEGFSSVEGDHTKEIKKLQAKITTRTTDQKTRYLKALSIAAGILLVAGFGTWYAMNEYQQAEETSYTTQELAKSLEKNGEEQIILDQSELSDSSTQEEAQESPLPEEVKPTQAPPAIADIDRMIADSTPLAEKKVTTELSRVPIPLLADIADEESIAEENFETVKEQADTILRDQVATISAMKVGKNDLGSVVKGRVIDEGGLPLIGATITTKNSSNATITDKDGYFELITHKGEKMQVDYIGYEPQTFMIDTSQTMQIAMHENQAALSEVVVVGYGTTKKKALSGSTKEKAPEPVKGKRAYTNYLKENLTRPTDDGCRDAKGEVELTFYVNESGRPHNIQVTKSICPSADAEAIRLLSTGPDWTPGTGQSTLKIKF